MADYEKGEEITKEILRVHERLRKGEISSLEAIKKLRNLSR